ncbi:MAG: DUF1844 domain-containing protein [Candidatus Omnitrophota bacterium]
MEFSDKTGDSHFETDPDFNIFVTSLGMQAMIFMGEMINPITNQTTIELSRAKYLIDTIAMIKEKTSGNLKADEQKLIDDILCGLRLKFVEKSK